MSQRWLRYVHAGITGFGTLSDDRISVHAGDLYTKATPTGQTLNLGEVKLLMPTQPSKVIALWNNFRALGDKLQLSAPAEPLYFLKAPNSLLNPGEVIRMPSQPGKIVFEGELGIVIGETASGVNEADASGLDPQSLVVQTWLNGSLRQEFPISDMRFSVAQLVSRISADMTLLAGDIILSGTSLGVGSMKPGSDIEVGIAGIGKLANRFE